MTKALGTIVYLSDTTTFQTVCAISVSGGGIEAAAVEIEPCLNATIVGEEPGDVKRKPITVRYKKVVGASEVSANLEGFCAAKTLVYYAQKFPTTTPVYGTRTGYITDHDNDETDRNQDLTCTMTLVPNSDWTYSTTAPTTA